MKRFRIGEGDQAQAIANPRAKAATEYLEQVKLMFPDQPEVYKEFLDILQDFKTERIDQLCVIKRASRLFGEHTELIVGIGVFLPPAYSISVLSNGNVQVTIDDRVFMIDNTSATQSSEDPASEPETTIPFGPVKSPSKGLARALSTLSFEGCFPPNSEASTSSSVSQKSCHSNRKILFSKDFENEQSGLPATIPTHPTSHETSVSFPEIFLNQSESQTPGSLLECSESHSTDKSSSGPSEPLENEPSGLSTELISTSQCAKSGSPDESFPGFKELLKNEPRGLPTPISSKCSISGSPDGSFPGFKELLKNEPRGLPTPISSKCSISGSPDGSFPGFKELLKNEPRGLQTPISSKCSISGSPDELLPGFTELLKNEPRGLPTPISSKCSISRSPDESFPRSEISENQPSGSSSCTSQLQEDSAPLSTTQRTNQPAPQYSTSHSSKELSLGASELLEKESSGSSIAPNSSQSSISGLTDESLPGPSELLEKESSGSSIAPNSSQSSISGLTDESLPGSSELLGNEPTGSSTAPISISYSSISRPTDVSLTGSSELLGNEPTGSSTAPISMSHSSISRPTDVSLTGSSELLEKESSGSSIAPNSSQSSISGLTDESSPGSSELLEKESSGSSIAPNSSQSSISGLTDESSLGSSEPLENEPSGTPTVSVPVSQS